MRLVRHLSVKTYVYIFSVALVILPAALVSFAQDSAFPPHHHFLGAEGDEKNPLHWDYLGIEGPEHWGMLSKEYMACETGGKQSPIDIRTQGLSHHQENLEFLYNISELHEINNGHTIQISHKSGCKVDLNKRAYKLRQFHFHEPSEHHINGKAFPMEMHLVHQDEAGQVLVIAVMMEIGPEHPTLKNLWNWLPKQIGEEISFPIKANLREILPASTEHFSYSGSLTTPPCSEGVQWIVLTEPIQISEQSVKKFSAIVGHNARPVQPLGKRHIELN